MDRGEKGVAFLGDGLADKLLFPRDDGETMLTLLLIVVVVFVEVVAGASRLSIENGFRLAETAATAAAATLAFANKLAYLAGETTPPLLGLAAPTMPLGDTIARFAKKPG